jgi:hypothetical protein
VVALRVGARRIVAAVIVGLLALATPAPAAQAARR